MDTFHSPIAPYDDEAHAEPSSVLGTHESTAVFNSAKSTGANTAPTDTVPQTTPTNNTTADTNHVPLRPQPPLRLGARCFFVLFFLCGGGGGGVGVAGGGGRGTLTLILFLVPSLQHATDVESPLGRTPTPDGDPSPALAVLC
jgi:hypothetical protein